MHGRPVGEAFPRTAILEHIDASRRGLATNDVDL